MILKSYFYLWDLYHKVRLGILYHMTSNSYDSNLHKMQPYSIITLILAQSLKTSGLRLSWLSRQATGFESNVSNQSG